MGLDVHARSVVVAAIGGVTGELVRARLTASHEQIRSWLGHLPRPPRHVVANVAIASELAGWCWSLAVLE